MIRPATLLLLAASLALGPATLAHARSRAKKDSLADQALKAVQSALVQPPKDLETCFSPDEPCDQKLIKFIDSATRSVDVAVYDINLDQLVHRLLVASRKIQVRIVVDRRQAKGEHSLVSTLLKGGARVRLGRQRGIMHNKFVIVDGKRVEIGSFNFTNGAAFKNNENQLYLANPEVVDRYRSRFEKLWSEGDEP